MDWKKIMKNDCKEFKTHEEYYGTYQNEDRKFHQAQ